MKKVRITPKPETQEAVKPAQERANPLNEESPIEKRWYVVYNGPKPGIYGTWPKASKAISGISGLIHKSFENRIEAEGSYKEFNMPKLLTPNDIITNLVDKEDVGS
jgi:viroplasmin and RNaseH domain-containing protein